MAIGIGSSDSLSLINRLNQTDTAKQKSTARIASGLRLQSAADGAAELSVALSQLAKSDTLTVAGRNVQDALSVQAIQEGVLNSANEQAIEAAVASVQSRNGTYSDSQRELINQTVAARAAEVQRQVSTAEFNGTNVFEGKSFQVGTTGGADDQISSSDLSAQVQAQVDVLNAIDVSTAEGAGAGIDAANQAISGFSSVQGTIGATSQRLEAAGSQIAVSRETAEASAAAILDTDIAQEAASLTNISIQQQLAVASLKENTSGKKLVLSLIA